MSNVEQVENEELAKKQHFEAMERVGQINLFEDAYQQQKLKAAKEKEAATAQVHSESSQSQSNGEQELQNGEQNTENGASEQPNGERIEQNGAPVFEQAIAKLEAEMKKNDTYTQVIGKFLTEFLKQRPDVADKLLVVDKSIAGSLQAMRIEAEKRKVGNCAVLTDEEGFAIVLGYFGITGQVPASNTDVTALAQKMADKIEQPVPQQSAVVVDVERDETSAPSSTKQNIGLTKLSFDVDIDELL